MLRDDSECSYGRQWITVHVLLSLFQFVAVSWTLLTPDPFTLVRDTSLSWVQGVSDVLLHVIAFTVLSATVCSLSVAICGKIPAVIIVVMLGYSVLVEGLQVLVASRTCDPRDAIGNVAGFVLGLTVARIFSQLRLAPAKT